jgi:3-deoxy-D-manno-octulosonic-acid transferase
VATSPLYRTLVRAAVPLVPLLLRDDRQQRAHAGRRDAPATLAAWARHHRDPGRPLAWFHAPSVGEGLQAKAVFEALRLLRPDVQLLYTHFSPSAERFAAALQVDGAAYLPYDRADDVAAALDVVRPTLLVFTKLDLWPELATQARARGVRVAMVAATVSPASSRLRWPAAGVTRAGYEALEAAGAISAADGARMGTLGVPADRVVVTGDPRVDSVLEVVASVDPLDPLLTIADPTHTLVAGSSWPADEAVLLPAFAQVRTRHPQARLVVVPHEPTPEHLDRLDGDAVRLGLPTPVRLGQLVPGSAPAIVVGDRLGILARLYANGQMAYVGGGFGESGIHSVLEPAAWGRPIVIGPADRGSRDVALLRASGRIDLLPRDAAIDALRARWGEMLDHPDRARAEGQRNRAALEGERGAAERSARMLLPLLR